MSGDKSAFRGGWGFATLIVGGVATVLALFNWATQTFDWPLAPFAEPIVTLYRDAIVSLMETVSLHAEWAIPDWPPQVFGLALIAAALSGRVLGLFGSNPAPWAPLFYSLLLLLLLFVPYARWYSVLVIALLFLTPIWWLLVWQGYKDNPNAGVLFEENYDEIYLRIILYIVGNVASTALALFANYYYA